MSYSSIVVVGLGYVGLPLAIEIGKKHNTIGFDINQNRINDLKSCVDRTLEVDENDFKMASQLRFTENPNDIATADLYIITVPTPIDEYKKPDLTPLVKASELVGGVITKGATIVYESTVYPGCTEEICIPILERVSGLEFNVDFFCGYSPERINPGDKERRVHNIMKVVSGSNEETAEKLNEFYGSIITAGTHLTSSIKVAEASKVIENAQRDINIAFVNELALIFDKIGIDTKEVLAAAGTKWNFLNFTPGLVGGHCIGVDPYYLTYKAEQLGYLPQVILSGRRINDDMGSFIANKVVKLISKSGRNLTSSSILLLGITFKENCPDIRNSRAIDIVKELGEFNITADVYDPHADPKEVKHEYGIDLIAKPAKEYDAIILAVSHDEFLTMDFSKIINTNSIVYDVKSFLPMDIVTDRL